MSKRSAKVKRETKETKITISLDLDNSQVEKNKIETGCGFLDHMLILFSTHGDFRVDISCKGDTNVDYHHTVEDVGILLGQAFKEALGDMKGINRYGYIILPMDETLMLAATDISGRAFLDFDVEFYTEKVGDLDTELFKEFFLAFTRKAEITLHFKMISGENSHHIAEACFKAFGRIMKEACSLDDKKKDKIPSTKGVLV